MKTLVSLAALLAAALASYLFPDMKKILLLIPFALVALAFVSGCNHFERALREMPDGHFDSVTISHTNLGIGTKLVGTGLDKHDGIVTAEKLTGTHNDPWTGTSELILDNGSVVVGGARAKKKAVATESVGPGGPVSAPPAIH